jgi:hypothetical protein
MRDFNVIIRIKLAAACKCINKVTENSSSWAVYKSAGFRLHEVRSVVSFQEMSCFHYELKKKQRQFPQ